MYKTCLGWQEIASRTAYHTSLLRWAQGTSNSSCQLPCRTTTIKLKTIFKAGLKSHQEVRMANGNTLNLYARPGKENEIFVSLLVIIVSFKVHLPEKTTT